MRFRFFHILKCRGEDKYQIECFVQTDPEAHFFEEYPIKSINEVDFSIIDYLVIGTRKYYSEIMISLKQDKNYDKFMNKIIDTYGFMELVQSEAPTYLSCTLKNGLNFIYHKQDIYRSINEENRHMQWGK